MHMAQTVAGAEGRVRATALASPSLALPTPFLDLHAHRRTWQRHSGHRLFSEKRDLTIGDGDDTHSVQDALELLNEPNTYFARALRRRGKG